MDERSRQKGGNHRGNSLCSKTIDMACYLAKPSHKSEPDIFCWDPSCAVSQIVRKFSIYIFGNPCCEISWRNENVVSEKCLSLDGLGLMENYQKLVLGQQQHCQHWPPGKLDTWKTGNLDQNLFMTFRSTIKFSTTVPFSCHIFDWFVLLLI